MQGRILSSEDEVPAKHRLSHLNIMRKLETTQINKVDVGSLIHKDKLSQALSSLQDNLEDYSDFFFLLPMSPPPPFCH